MSSLKSQNMSLADSKRNVWQVFADPTLTPQDLLDPKYWAHVAKDLRHPDRIEVLAEDATWAAVYVVLESGHNWAKVYLMSEVKFAAEDVPALAPRVYDDFEIKLRGVRKWSVLRKADNSVLKENLMKREDAIGWLGEHLRTLAAY